MLKIFEFRVECGDTTHARLLQPCGVEAMESHEKVAKHSAKPGKEEYQVVTDEEEKR